MHRVLTEKVFPRQAVVTVTDERIASLSLKSRGGGK